MHSTKHSTIHLNQLQTDACIQTVGLQEPENLSLRHIKGKLQISKQITQQQQTNYQEMMERAWNHQSSLNQPTSRSYRQNEMFSTSHIYNKLIDVYADAEERIKQQAYVYHQQNNSNIPLLDFSSRLTQSNHLKNPMPKISNLNQEFNNRGITNYRPNNFLKLQNEQNDSINIYQTTPDEYLPKQTDDAQIQTRPRKFSHIEIPSTKPRNRGVSHDLNSQEILYHEIGRPTVKPRGKLSQGVDNYSNDYMPINEIMREPIRRYNTKSNDAEKYNPMPKQRNSVHYTQNGTFFFVALNKYGNFKQKF